jgi:hypothetical protein
MHGPAGCASQEDTGKQFNPRVKIQPTFGFKYRKCCYAFFALAHIREVFQWYLLLTLCH